MIVNTDLFIFKKMTAILFSASQKWTFLLFFRINYINLIILWFRTYNNFFIGTTLETGIDFYRPKYQMINLKNKQHINNEYKQ